MLRVAGFPRFYLWVYPGSSCLLHAGFRTLTSRDLALSFALSMHPSLIHLYPLIHPSIHPSTHPPIHPSMDLSIHPQHQQPPPKPTEASAERGQNRCLCSTNYSRKRRTNSWSQGRQSPRSEALRELAVLSSGMCPRTRGAQHGERQTPRESSLGTTSAGQHTQNGLLLRQRASASLSTDSILGDRLN